MDTKKNLKPELKEIYERVMSTKVGSPSNTQANTASSTDSATAPTPPTPASPVVPPSPVTPPVTNTEQTANAISLTPPQASDTSSVNTDAPYLTSSAPRKVVSTGSFVFSTKGKVVTDNTEAKKETKTPDSPAVKQTVVSHTATGQKTGSLKFVLGILVVVFLVLWTVFWLFYFKII